MGVNNLWNIDDYIERKINKRHSTQSIKNKQYTRKQYNWIKQGSGNFSGRKPMKKYNPNQYYHKYGIKIKSLGSVLMVIIHNYINI